eukprot:COSAG02_NODE_39771_length_413_cov_0.662420_1_plen_28_part_10
MIWAFLFDWLAAYEEHEVDNALQSARTK